MSSADADLRALILHRLDQIERKQDETLEQARLTNGRVTALEKWRDRTEGAKEALGAFRGVMTIVAAGLIMGGVVEFVRYLATH